MESESNSKRPFYYFKPDGEKVDQTPGQRIIVREDGRIEQGCDHGCGHPIGHLRKDGWVASWMGVHGCCGCCYKAEFHLETLGKRPE